MSQTQFHADLMASQFPYNFYELSNTVLVNREFEQDARDSRNPGLPQAYFMQNVLPTSRGYSSVGFTEKVPANEELGTIVNKFVIYGEDGQIGLFVSDEDSAWVYEPGTSQWVQLETSILGLPEVTYGTIREVTYIHLVVGLYKYDFTTQELVLVELSSLEGIGDTLGICSSGSQLILWTDDRLYISSVIDPLDFTPSIGTGAQTTKIQQLRGRIVACVSLGKDFIVYSELHAIAARWTNNLAFPYSFAEITGSAGIKSFSQVAFNSNTGIHVTWTQSGFQQVTVEGAQYIWEELSDGITRGISIKNNDIFGIPELHRGENLEVTLHFVSNRYLAVSTKEYDSGSADQQSYFYDCYIYDSVLQRWGCINVPHVGFLEYVVPEIFNAYTYDMLAADYITYGAMETGSSYRSLAPDQTEVIESGTNLGIILPDGSVQAISFSETADFRGTDGADFGAATPTLVLGKYKINREEGVLLQWLKVNKLFDAEITIYGHDYLGKLVVKKTLEFENPNHEGQWFGRTSADAISVRLEGSFNLTDLICCVSSAGRVNQRRQSIEALVVATTEPFAVPEYTYATSVLYMLGYTDEIFTTNAAVGATSLLKQPNIEDEVNLSVHVVGNIDLTDTIHEYDYWPTEELNLSPDVSGSVELIDTIHEYDNWVTEELNQSIEIVGETAELILVLIPYDNWPIEELNQSFSVNESGTIILA